MAGSGRRRRTAGCSVWGAAWTRRRAPLVWADVRPGVDRRIVGACCSRSCVPERTAGARRGTARRSTAGAELPAAGVACTWAASELRDLRLRCWSSARSVGAQRASTTPTPVKTRAMRRIPSSCSLETPTLRAPKAWVMPKRVSYFWAEKNHPCAVLLSLTGVSLSGPENGKALPRRRR